LFFTFQERNLINIVDTNVDTNVDDDDDENEPILLHEERV
jgi:hypothetical protein